MRKHSFTFLFFNCLLFMTPSFGQTAKLDSLLHLLKTIKEDTTKVNIFNNLFLEYEYADGLKAKECLDNAFALSQKVDYKKGQAVAYLFRGYFSEDKGNYDEALKNYLASLKISEIIADKKGIADCYGNIGNVYTGKANYPEALKSYFLSLKIREGMNDKKGMASAYSNIATVYSYLGKYPDALKNYFVCLKMLDELGEKSGTADAYNNIGNVYYAQGNHPEALKNYFLSLKIRKEIGDKRGESGSYNNIGVVYADDANYTEALKNHIASLKIKEAIGDTKGIATCYNNIGLVYYSQATKEKNPMLKLNDALKNYFISLKIKEQIGDQAGMAGSYYNIGNVYIELKKFNEAEIYLIKAKTLSQKIGYKEILKTSYYSLAKIDSAKINYKGAFENYKLFVLYRDSLNNEETRKKTIQGQMTYDFEKKEAIADAEHKKELENQKLIANEKSRKQKIVLLLVSCFLLLVVVFAGFVFRSLRTTRKQKDIIEEQKDLVQLQKEEMEHQKNLVEEKQKEIIDSIKYARRIQTSLLPTEKYIEGSIRRLMKN